MHFRHAGLYVLVAAQGWQLRHWAGRGERSHQCRKGCWAALACVLEGVHRREAVIFFLLMIKIDFLLTPLLNRDSVF